MKNLLVLASLLAGHAEALAGTNSCVPGFGHAVFGKDGVRMTGGAVTDSYNSATSTFTLFDGDADIGTNASTCDAVSLSGGVVVNGDVTVGSSSTACTIANNSSTINGTAVAQSQNITLPPVSIPTVGTYQGDVSCGGSCAQPKTLAPNQTYGHITVASGAELRLAAGTYVIGGMRLNGNSTLVVASAPVLVYVNCEGGRELDLSGGTVTNSTLISTNLVFMLGPSCASAKVTGGTASSYALYAPDTDIAISGGSHIYGAVVGKTITSTGGTQIHYDRALETFSSGPFVCTPGEVSRSSPIVASIAGSSYVVQGSYEYPYPTKVPLTTTSVGTWTFQYIKGHLRARPTSNITASASSYSTATTLFDAALSVPPASNTGCTSRTGACRRIFTTTNTTPASGLTYRPALVTLGDSTAATVGPLVTAPLAGAWTATHHTAIVRALLRAPLGGIDRSTVAVIEPSKLAPGGTTRPTIAYFGGTDGMLHAACVTAGGTTASQTNICPQPGTELWAFLPRVQLPLVGNLDTRIDGSVHVVDAFGDFTTATMTGQRTFRTILTFQTGYASSLARPAAYAIDVTDPASPVLLWEYTTPPAPGTLDFGTGLRATPGRANLGTSPRPTNFVAFETNNGGSGTSGVIVAAHQLETGARLWQFGSTYPTAAGVPASGLPGGAVAVDRTSSGYVTDLVFGDLYGRLWRLDISGANAYGTQPVFQFAGLRRPIGAAPAIYSNGSTLYAAFASGGYADQTGTSWNTPGQYLIAVKLAPTVVPVDETATACQATCNLQLEKAITGSYGSAQATVVGNSLVFTTDSSEINATGFGSVRSASGLLSTFDLTSGASTTAVIYSGIGSLAVAPGTTAATIYSAGNDKQQQVGSAASAGPVIDHTLAKLSRKLWLRTQ